MMNLDIEGFNTAGSIAEDRHQRSNLRTSSLDEKLPSVAAMNNRFKTSDAKSSQISSNKMINSDKE